MVKKLLKLKTWVLVFALIIFSVTTSYGQCSESIASSSPTFCINTLLTNITRTTEAATVIGTAINTPSGVTALWASNTITISGTLNTSGTFNYTIPLTGGGCGSEVVTGIFKSNPNATINLTSGTGSNNQTFCNNALMTNITFGIL